MSGYSPPLKTSVSEGFIAAVSIIVEVATVVVHQVAVHHVGVHHLVVKHVVVQYVPAVLGHHVPLLAAHVGVPVGG